MNRKSITRRHFINAAAGAAAVPLFLPSRLFGETAPSKRITLGFIGMGLQGTRANLNAFLNQPDAQVIAVCDVLDKARQEAQNIVNERTASTGCKAVNDFREIIADKTIDAVVISTPDHWHVPMALMALEAGKDVFCEKPTLTIAEGRILVEAVKKSRAVFQMGIEDRSLAHFHRMIEWIRNGAIGELQRIEVSLPCGTDYPKEEPAPVPKGLDYNLWLGPAPYHPYTPNRLEWQHWREIRDYSGGMITDWGSHLVDTAQLAADAPGTCPIEVEGTGSIPADSMTTVPITFDLTYRYANGIEMHIQSGPTPSDKSASIRMEGTKGWVGKNGWYGGMETNPPEILHTRYTPETSRYGPLPPSEQRNFLDCVKTRKPTTYPAETMRHLCNTLHMGLIAIQTGRKLRWDSQTDSFIDDKQANQLRSRPARDYDHPSLPA